MTNKMIKNFIGRKKPSLGLSLSLLAHLLIIIIVYVIAIRNSNLGGFGSNVEIAVEIISSKDIGSRAGKIVNKKAEVKQKTEEKVSKDNKQEEKEEKKAVEQKQNPLSELDKIIAKNVLTDESLVADEQSLEQDKKIEQKNNDLEKVFDQAEKQVIPEENTHSQVVKQTESQESKAEEPIENYDEYIKQNFSSLFENQNSKLDGNSVTGKDSKMGGEVMPSGAGLTMAEKNIIKNQISKCWINQNYSTRGQNLKIIVRASLTESGIVTQAEVVDEVKPSYLGATEYLAIKKNAVRAVVSCSPIKGLPAYKYSLWKTLELNFVINNGNLVIN